MKYALSLLTIVTLATGSFALGCRHGWRKRDAHAFENGYRWGIFERALYDQRMTAAEHGSFQPVPGFEAEAAQFQAQSTPPATSYLPAAQH